MTEAEEFLFQTTTLPCCNCEHRQSIVVLEAQLRPVFCEKCGKEAVDEKSRNGKLAEKISPSLALSVDAFMNAHAGGQNTDPRKSILNSFCALEIFLKEKWLGQLKRKNVDRNLVEYLANNIKHRDGSINLLKALGFSRPDKVEDRINKLGKMRDRVAHRGYVPTIAEAKDFTKEVINLLAKIQAPPLTLGELASLRSPYRSLNEALVGARLKRED